MSKQYEIGNKTVLVTGGANGIGEALVYELVKKGSNVVFLDIDAKKGKQIEKKLSGKAVFVEADITKDADLQRALQQIHKKFDRVNVLINNVGIMRAGKFVDTRFEDVINTNLIGNMNMTQNILPFMKSKDKILNVLSIYGYLVRSNKISYDVSNAGLLMFTKSLAHELKEREISVNAISFGVAKTRMMDLDACNQAKADKIAEPVDIATHIITVLESFSTETTGSNFVVDGL